MKIGTLSTAPDARAILAAGVVVGLSVNVLGALTPSVAEAEHSSSKSVQRGVLTAGVIALAFGAAATIATRNVWPLVAGAGVSLFTAKMYQGALMGGR